jgi:hypothetical protein
MLIMQPSSSARSCRAGPGRRQAVAGHAAAIIGAVLGRGFVGRQGRIKRVIGVQDDRFEDLAALGIQLTDAEEAAFAEVKARVQSYPRMPVRARATDPWGMIPLRLGLRLAKELSGAHWNVLLHLSYQMILTKGTPVPATCKRTGCGRARDRREAVRRLEALGLATVEWRGENVTPLVTLTPEAVPKRT